MTTGVLLSSVSRRDFVARVAAALPVLALAPHSFAEATAGPRVLDFSHLHTGERLEVEYFSGGTYVPDALRAIDQLLRDFRTGDVHRIEPGLLDLLHQLASATDSRRPFEVISGYRSAASNAQMKAQGRGVASSSLHTEGKAIDVRVPGRRLDSVRDAALALARGGVGYYPQDGFVHVDVGRVRRW